MDRTYTHFELEVMARAARTWGWHVGLDQAEEVLRLEAMAADSDVRDALERVADSLREVPRG